MGPLRQWFLKANFEQGGGHEPAQQAQEPPSPFIKLEEHVLG